jgi:hypothetical protein
MKVVLRVLALLALVLIPARAFAQTPDVNNPSKVAFTVSPDHALVTSYELDILRPDGSVLQTLNLGKPTPDASGTVEAPLNVQPVTFGKGYSVQVRSIANDAKSDNAPGNKFDRVPGAPSKVVAK